MLNCFLITSGNLYFSNHHFATYKVREMVLASLGCQNQMIPCLASQKEHVDRRITVDLVRLSGPTLPTQNESDPELNQGPHVIHVSIKS